MTNNSLPKHEFTLIADDIRFEKGNKISLMGIYGEEIVVESLPAILLKLCFFTRISGGDGECQIKVSLKGPDGNDLFMSMKEQTLALKGGMANITNVVSPFQLPKEGKYTYSIFLNGMEFFSIVLTAQKGVIS